MTRYRNDQEDYYEREEQRRRESPWRYDEPDARRSRSLGDYEGRAYSRGRFGERASYERDEPRYSGYTRREGDYGYSSGVDREYSRQRFGERERFRSRLRARDIMTRELAVATGATTLHEVAKMMKDEDTGIIPVVEYEGSGNGSATGERRLSNHAKLVGLITDRDIVIRAVAEGRDCGATRAEDIMSTGLQTAKPTDRVIDVLRKMGDKQVRRIPVVGENGNLLGLISMGDIALETEADSELADALEDVSKESSFWSRIFG
jgi:CBS domain-containing protein